MDILSMFYPGVSVVVVNYRTPDLLQGFVDSYREYEPKDCELIVVNVEPLPKDLEVGESAPFAQHIVASRNVGYGRACNRAAQQTSKEVIAFFNADTRLRFGVVDECCAALLEHDDWGILGPRQVDENNRIIHAGVVGTNASPSLRGWRRQDQGQYCDVESVVSVSGAAYFVKRRVWDEMRQCETFKESAPFAEGAFLDCEHYYNETALSYHATAHGWKVIYYGPVVMDHFYHKSSKVGGYGERMLKQDRAYFRNFCDHHGIEHD